MFSLYDVSRSFTGFFNINLLDLKLSIKWRKTEEFWTVGVYRIHELLSLVAKGMEEKQSYFQEIQSHAIVEWMFKCW